MVFAQITKENQAFQSFLFAKVDLLKAQTMYANLQTSFDSEKIAEHIDTKDNQNYTITKTAI